MPDINYRINVDTTQLSNSMSEIRSQLNTGVSSGFGFMDTGRAAMGGLQDFGGAASAGGAAMMSGMRNIPMPTFVHMDQGIAFTPHYGVMNAQASLQSEWLNRFYGPAGAAPFTPPGVSPTQYSGFLTREHERKFAEAKTDAIIAGGGAAANFVAGEIGYKAMSFIGGAVGGLIGGPPGAMIGSVIGGIGGAVAGAKISDLAVGEIKESRAITSQLGTIIDAHRMLPEGLQRQLAAAAVEGGRQVGSNPQEVADYMARASKLGTLPPTQDPGEMKAQTASAMQDIKDFSAALRVATGAAQEMMRTMERYGHRGIEGADWLISQAGRIGMGFTPTQVYGLMEGGASMGRNAQIGGGFGAKLMPDLAAEGTHGGLNREQLQMAGGVTGMAGALATNVLGNAFGPMGMLQIAGAPTTGDALPRTLEDTLSKGINNLSDDFPFRFMALDVGRGEALRSLGPDRVTEMAKQSLRNVVDVMAPIMGHGEEGREIAARHVLMGQGMTEFQAKSAAYRFVNAGAKEVENASSYRYLQQLQRDRAADHAAEAGSEDMAVRASLGVLGGWLPEAGISFVKGVEQRLRGAGASLSISEGNTIEKGTREAYARQGRPYAYYNETLADVESGVIGTRGVKAPDRGSFVGGEMAKLSVLLGGDATSVGEMLTKANALGAAVGGFTGDYKDLVLSKSGMRAAQIMHADTIKDDAGATKRLRDLSEALPGNDPKSIHDKLLAVVRGTEWAKDLNRKGSHGLPLEAIPVIMQMGKQVGVDDLGKGLLGLAEATPENINKYIAQEHDVGKYVAGVPKKADSLADMLDYVSHVHKPSKVDKKTAAAAATGHQGDGDSSSGDLGGLANLIARQNGVLDNIVAEQARLRGKRKGTVPNRTTSGSGSN